MVSCAAAGFTATSIEVKKMSDEVCFFVHYSHITLGFGGACALDYMACRRAASTRTKPLDLHFQGKKRLILSKCSELKNPAEGCEREEISEFLIVEEPACGTCGRCPWPSSPCRWWWEAGA
jgi:hypothetical protein